MAKTIEDYKKDYADAAARGDKAGMAAANNGANAIRQQQGQKVEVADVTKEVYGNNYVGAPSRGSSGSSSSSSGTSSGSRGSSGTTPGNSAAGVSGFTDWQQDIIDKMNQNSNAWHGASQAEKDRLHAENEYLSGLLGGNVSFDKNSGKWSGVADFPAFDYGNAPEFTSRWDDIIGDLADQILNRDPFEYDYLEDPNYQQYRDAYTREGERAMQDTIGEVAARTGGLASSYATSAANQANNYYMSALADKIPELRQMAYQAYLTGIQNQRDDLSMIMGLENMDYGKYMDSLSQWNSDRNFDYGIWRDQVNDQRYEQEMDYNKQLAAAQVMASAGDFSGYASIWGLTEDQVKLLVSDFAQQRATSEQQAAMELADYFAKWGDFSKLKELGVNTSYMNFMRSSGGSRGGSSGRGSSGGGGGGVGNSDIYQIMYESGIQDEASAYAWLVSQGYNTTQSGKFAGYYADWLKDKEKENNPDNSGSEETEGSWFDRLFSGVFGSGGSTGMNDARFRAAMQSVSTSLQMGRPENAIDGIDGMWPQLSSDQRNQLTQLLRSYGYEYNYEG